MEGNPVRWFEIYVQDLTRAKKFYEAVFQCPLERMKVPNGSKMDEMPEMEMANFPMDIKQTGASGALVKMAEVPSGGNSTLVYFSCTDCAVEEGRVAKAGGKVHRQKMSIGEYGFISLIHDTEGNLVGLHSMK